MRGKLLLLAPLAIALVAAADSSPPDWSTADLGWLSPNAAEAYAASRAICAAVVQAEPPAADRPSSAEMAELQDCDSEALYFGIGVPADPAAARKCAFAEEAALEAGARAGPFIGRSMLMVIYANGRGAARDLGVATHLACGLGDAPAEMDHRIRRLDELRQRGWAGTGFSPCDDATSGWLGGMCAAHAKRFEDIEREQEWAALTASWPAQRKADLEALNRVHEAFVEAHGDGEIDLSGTLRAAIYIAAADKLRDQHRALIRDLDLALIHPADAERYRASDRDLNEAYRALLANDEMFSSDLGPSREGVRRAERAWLGYRDALLAFARRHYPAASQDGIAARLTDARTEMLRIE